METPEYIHRINSFNPTYLYRKHRNRENVIKMFIELHNGEKLTKDPMRTTCLGITLYDKFVYLHPNITDITAAEPFHTSLPVYKCKELVFVIWFIVQQLYEDMYDFETITFCASSNLERLNKLYVYVLNTLDHRLSIPTIYDHLEHMCATNNIDFKFVFRIYCNMIQEPLKCMNTIIIAQKCVNICHDVQIAFT